MYRIFICSHIYIVFSLEQMGPLVAPAKLPTLSSEQLRSLSMAKKYCQDITAKHVSSVTVFRMLLGYY